MNRFKKGGGDVWNKREKEGKTFSISSSKLIFITESAPYVR